MDLLDHHRKAGVDPQRAYPQIGRGHIGRKEKALLLAGMPAQKRECQEMV